MGELEDKLTEIDLSPDLLEGAKRAAEANGVSLEAYVAEAVRLRLQSDPKDDMSWFFTPGHVDELGEAAAEARELGSLKPADVEAHFVNKHEGWPSDPPV